MTARHARFEELDRLIAADPDLSFHNNAGETVQFTLREIDILKALVSGSESNQAISSLLEISADTARVYICRLHRKLGLQNRTALALWAERNLSAGGSALSKKGKPS